MKTSTVPFPRCLQNVADIQELTSIVSFRRRRWSQWNFSENRNTQGSQSKDMLKDYEEILFLPTLALPFWEVKLTTLLENGYNCTKKETGVELTVL